MKTPKRVSVAKRPSAEQIQDAARWQAFIKASQIHWGNLSEEFKDFFWVIGSTESSEEDINNAVDLAMKGDNK